MGGGDGADVIVRGGRLVARFQPEKLSLSGSGSRGSCETSQDYEYTSAWWQAPSVIMDEGTGQVQTFIVMVGHVTKDSPSVIPAVPELLPFLDSLLAMPGGYAKMVVADEDARRERVLLDLWAAAASGREKKQIIPQFSYGMSRMTAACLTELGAVLDRDGQRCLSTRLDCWLDRPVDALGRLLVEGDKISSTPSYESNRFFDGVVAGLKHENQIEVKRGDGRIVTSPAFLWLKWNSLLQIDR